MSWAEIAEHINRNFRNDETEYRTESAYRKIYTNAKRYYEAGVFSSNDEYLVQIQEQKRELERLKIQYRDERRAWQQQNFTSARVEEKLNYLENQLSTQGKINFPEIENISVSSDNDMLVILSDLHIGQTFYSCWGCYDSGIAKSRLAQLLSEIIAIQKLHHSENCFISLQGDLISGNIHKTIQVNNRENVIDQIKTASELVTNFCYQLSSHFSNIYFSSVVGNHSRIDKKDEAIHDERLDDIVAWSVGLSLHYISNFHILDTNLDSGISTFEIRNKLYTAVHGDYDLFAKSGVSNLCMHLGYIPYAVLFGHMHTCAIDEANGVKMIRGGSLAGSGDQYTIEKRLTGKPSQMVCICTEKGVQCYYPVELE